jgi:alpha-D-ribose 1-methylphosphonate 5-triphosphate synthase subunit PhnG
MGWVAEESAGWSQYTRADSFLNGTHDRCVAYVSAEHRAIGGHYGVTMQRGELALSRKVEAMTNATDRQGHGNYCGAKKRQGEGTCRRPAGWGTDHAGVGHCKLHGGCTKNQRKKAKSQIVDAEVREILQREPLNPVSDPLHQLQMLAAEILRIKDIFAAKVEALSEWEYRNDDDNEELRAVIQGYERGLDRANRVLVSMARLDLDERFARIDEARAIVVAAVIERVLDGVGVDPKSIDVRASVARELIRMAG